MKTFKWIHQPGSHLWKYYHDSIPFGWLAGYVEKLPLYCSPSFRAFVYAKPNNMQEMFNSESEAKVFVEALVRLEDS